MARLGERDDPRGDLALDGRGWVTVNEGANYWESHLLFGGRAGSASGVGRVGGRFSIEHLTELKTIVVHLG
jgi:acyl-CoA reductase-like NAD-dependent aldehyde dehydrogenase